MILLAFAAGVMVTIWTGPHEYDAERPNDRPPWVREYLQRTQTRSNGRIKERTR